MSNVVSLYEAGLGRLLDQLLDLDASRPARTRAAIKAALLPRLAALDVGRPGTVPIILPASLPADVTADIFGVIESALNDKVSKERVALLLLAISLEARILDLADDGPRSA